MLLKPAFITNGFALLAIIGAPALLFAAVMLFFGLAQTLAQLIKGLVVLLTKPVRGAICTLALIIAILGVVVELNLF